MTASALCLLSAALAPFPWNPFPKLGNGDGVIGAILRPARMGIATRVALVAQMGRRNAQADRG